MAEPPSLSPGTAFMQWGNTWFEIGLGIWEGGNAPSVLQISSRWMGTRGWDFSELFYLFFQSFPPFVTLHMCHYAIIFWGVTFPQVLGKSKQDALQLKRLEGFFPGVYSLVDAIGFLPCQTDMVCRECPCASNCVCSYSLIWCVTTPGSWTSSSRVWMLGFLLAPWALAT